MYRNVHNRYGFKPSLHFQILLALIVSAVCCSTDATDKGVPSANTSEAVDYKTWQQEHIDSSLYLGNGVFLHKNNASNSSQGWLINTEDIPKLFRLGFPVSNTVNTPSDDSTTTEKQGVHTWVLALACFVGCLIILVAITVAILTRKWMNNTLRQRRRYLRDRENDRHQIVVEADPDAPKSTGPSTICGGLPRQIRLGWPPDDGLPPYTRLESPSANSAGPELDCEQPYSLPLPSYSEMAQSQSHDTVQIAREGTQTRVGASSINQPESDSYLHPSEDRHLQITSAEHNSKSAVHRQASIDGSGIENRFIPDWCESGNSSILERSNSVDGNALFSRQQSQKQQQITPTGSLSIYPGFPPSNLSNRQLHHFPASGNEDLAPMFIPTEDRSSRDGVSNTTQDAKRTKSFHSGQIEMCSQFSREEINSEINDIPNKQLQPRLHQTITSGGGELRNNDVRRDSQNNPPFGDDFSLSESYLMQTNSMDSETLSVVKDGIFIAE